MCFCYVASFACCVFLKVYLCQSLWLKIVEVFLSGIYRYPIYLAGRVCARPDQSPFVCSMSAAPGLASLLHTTQYTSTLSKTDYKSRVLGGLEGSGHRRSIRRHDSATQPPNAPSLTSLSRTWSMMFTKSLSICSLRLQTLNSLCVHIVEKPFSTDI